MEVSFRVSITESRMKLRGSRGRSRGTAERKPFLSYLLRRTGWPRAKSRNNGADIPVGLAYVIKSRGNIA